MLDTDERGTELNAVIKTLANHERRSLLGTISGEGYYSRLAEHRVRALGTLIFAAPTWISRRESNVLAAAQRKFTTLVTHASLEGETHGVAAERRYSRGVYHMANRLTTCQFRRARKGLESGAFV